MSKHQVKFEQFFAAPRARVFAYFSDHEKFGRIWGGKFRRIKDAEGAKDPNGLGSVREIRAFGLKFEETIVKYQAPSVIEYTITRGGPIKNHLGHIAFTEVAGGTQVAYTISFDPRLPLTGRLLGGVLCAAWHKGVDRAVREIAAGDGVEDSHLVRAR